MHNQSCLIKKNDDVLKCSRCERFVHYECTDLPVYQLQLFLTDKYEYYICVNFVTIRISLKRKQEVCTDRKKEETSK